MDKGPIVFTGVGACMVTRNRFVIEFVRPRASILDAFLVVTVMKTDEFFPFTACNNINEVQLALF